MLCYVKLSWKMSLVNQSNTGIPVHLMLSSRQKKKRTTEQARRSYSKKIQHEINFWEQVDVLAVASAILRVRKL